MYCWAIAGVIKAPPVYCRDAFMVDAGDARRTPEKPAPFSRFSDRVAFLERFTICRAEHSQGDVQRSQVGVAVFDRYVLVATTVANLTYVDPNYRRLGIATEMQAEFYAAHPEVIGPRKLGEVTYTYTPAGRRVGHRVYRLLLDRGAVVPPLEGTG